MNENTTNTAPFGFVLLSLERLEELERAEATLDIVKKILKTIDRYDSVSVLHNITGVRYEKPKEEDEE
jgi:hypothetical protein